MILRFTRIIFLVVLFSSNLAYANNELDSLLDRLYHSGGKERIGLFLDVSETYRLSNISFSLIYGDSAVMLADELGVKYKIIKQMGREISFLDDLVSIYKLFRLIKKEKPDIVHTHTAKAGTIGRLAAWLAGVL